MKVFEKISDKFPHRTFAFFGALALLLAYLSLGSYIGKVKIRLWFGENGYQALRLAKPAATENEYFLRKFLFPITAHVIDTEHGKQVFLEEIANKDDKDGVNFTEDVFRGRLNPRNYMLMNAFIAPIWSLFFAILVNGIEFLFTVILVPVSGFCYWIYIVARFLF